MNNQDSRTLIADASSGLASAIPTASVIIPTRNRPEKLERLLEALSDQSQRPVEVLIVDDSDDGNDARTTWQKLLPLFKQQKIHLGYLRNEGNKGAAMTRNRGAQAAHGEILVFLDDDLVIGPNYISALLQVYQDKPVAAGVGVFLAPPLVSILAPSDWRFKMINTFSRLVGWTHFVANRSTSRIAPHMLTGVIECTQLNGATCSYRRAVFEQVMFDERLEAEAFGEDVLISHQISQRGLGKLYLTPFAKCKHDYTYRTPGLRSVCRRVSYFLFVHFEINGYSLCSMFHAVLALIGTLAARLFRLVTGPSPSPGKDVCRELCHTTIGFLFTLRHLSKIRDGRIEDLNNELAFIK